MTVCTHDDVSVDPLEEDLQLLEDWPASHARMRHLTKGEALVGTPEETAAREATVPVEIGSNRDVVVVLNTYTHQSLSNGRGLTIDLAPQLHKFEGNSGAQLVKGQLKAQTLVHVERYGARRSQMLHLRVERGSVHLFSN